MNRAQRYSFEQLKEGIDQELKKPEVFDKLYDSTNNIFRIVDAIIKTKGENWASYALNKNGNKLLSDIEQQQFTEAFEPYLEEIINFFDNNVDEVNDEKHNTYGGAYIPTTESLSGMSNNFIKKKKETVTGDYEEDATKYSGIDDVYTKMIQKIRSLDKLVIDYASKYGVLRLEKEHDLEPDIRLIPKPIASLLSTGITALSTTTGTPIPPAVSMQIISKIKIPYRTVIFGIYLILDVARIAVSVLNMPVGRKILSIILSLLELLRGDWKKALLSFIGYYGMMPLLVGEIIKVFLSIFRTLSPELQDNIIFGSLDATKSMLIGVLLSIFQITAPDEIRLPLIRIFEVIAKKKAEIDGVLIEEGLSARPEYLSPTFQDLNNLQAIITDESFICSCEFEELINQVSNSGILRIILQILRIPVTKEFKELKCGKEACKPLVEKIVSNSIENTPTENIVKINQSAKIDETKETGQQEQQEQQEQLPQETKTNIVIRNRTQGGRILHSRLRNRRL